METCFKGAVKLAKTLDNVGAPLGDDNRSFDKRDDDEDGDGEEGNECWRHNNGFSFIFLCSEK
jgi:hypothetical protein